MEPNYYNENNPEAAAWLRELIGAGLIASGEVDERSITEIAYDELKRFNQCHFFAGIGGWSYALRLAGWPDDLEVWTGSCPCQPFSQAGKRKVDSDERHLWPAFRAAVAECRPSIIFGEQVASKDGRIWLAGVRADLEGLGYAVGAADLCAASVSAPHIRQRLYWVADANVGGHRNSRAGPSAAAPFLEQSGESTSRLAESLRKQVGRTGRSWQLSTDRLADDTQNGRPEGSADERRRVSRGAQKEERIRSLHGSTTGRLAVADVPNPHGGTSGGKQQIHNVSAASCWSDYELIWCADKKWRRIESGTFPLAHGIPARMGRLRGYGNAIVPQLAEVFIRSYLDTLELL